MFKQSKPVTMHCHNIKPYRGERQQCIYKQLVRVIRPMFCKNFGLELKSIRNLYQHYREQHLENVNYEFNQRRFIGPFNLKRIIRDVHK